MLRRAVAASSATSPGGSRQTLPSWNAAAATTPSTTSSRRKKSSSLLPFHASNNNNNTKLSSDVVVVGLLLGAAALLVLGAYWNNNSQQPARMVQMEQAASAEIAALWKDFHDIHGNLPPIPAHEHPQLATQQPPQGAVTSHENQNENNPQGGNTQNAFAAVSPPFPKSSVTGASWVQGEQLLKAELTKLAARQARGLDIGVPVLTRWLGPDVPAWPTARGDQMSTDEWQALVDAKYAAMRQEEEAWRQRMGEYLSSAGAVARG